jgi:hypothetical protein
MPNTLHKRTCTPNSSPQLSLLLRSHRRRAVQVATVEGGLPCWVRVGLPMAEGQEDLDAVPALNMPDAADEAGVARPGSPLGGLRDLLGGLTQRLPQLVPARR